MRRLICALVIVLALALPSWAATYYVDSSRPDDSGDGTTAGTAKKTIAAASALLADGDTLKFAKGGEWFERVLMGKNNVTYTTYGTGAAPITRWDTTLNPANWVNEHGGLWSYSYNKQCEAVSEDGTVLPRSSGPTIPEGAGHWYWDGSKIYYKTSKGVPSDHTVTSIWGVMAGTWYNTTNISGIVIDGIHFKFAGLNDAYGLIKSITIQNCIFEQVCGTGIWISNHGHCFTPPSVKILKNTFTACSNNIYLVSPNRKIWWLNGVAGGTIQEPKHTEGMTCTNPCEVTLTNHGLFTGAVVLFQGITQTNWTSLNHNGNKVSFTITRTSKDRFTLNGKDTSTYAAYNPATDPGTVVNGYMQGSFQGVVIRGNKMIKSNQLLDGSPWDPSGSGDIDGIALQCLKDSIIEKNNISGKCSSTSGSGAISYWTTDSNPSTADTTGNVFRYNYIHNVLGDGIIHAGAWYPVMNGKIYGNIIVNFGASGLNLNRGQTSANPSKIYNNTVVNGPTGIFIGGHGDHYILRNNLVSNCTHSLSLENMVASNLLDHNLYYHPTNLQFKQGGTAKTLAQYQALVSPQDASPVTADPKFVNGSGSYSRAGDFKLQSSSPARAAGVNVNLSTDYGGNVWGSPPSLGAWSCPQSPGERPLPEKDRKVEEKQRSLSGQKPSLPPRPRVLVPSPKLQLPQSEKVSPVLPPTTPR